uniref:Predicted protein n=1 Tax=Hordeum vulgare subsp. vulgare TaxID=112509 RepID=F2ELU9_HORVV|nr:predicted protein [Hordeum vulgare subsp. vulgare]
MLSGMASLLLHNLVILKQISSRENIIEVQGYKRGLSARCHINVVILLARGHDWVPIYLCRCSYMICTVLYK